MSHRTLIGTGVLCLFVLAVHAQAPAPQYPLIDELKALLEQELRDSASGKDEDTGKKRHVDRQGRAAELIQLIQDRILERIQSEIIREFGSIPSLAPEPVELEAVDRDGNNVLVPFSALARPLRALNIPEYNERAFSVLQTDGLTLALYDALPVAVDPEEEKNFWRIYTGADAEALAAEAKLVVSLKGGEWRAPQAGETVANAIAVRGLDLIKGLQTNSNKTYDDTMYVFVRAADAPTEVYEYRMTTESSSNKQGVGRLSAMQVIYVRGLHRGKDPAYRLKGNAAEGTREGLEGTHQILGANVHSAYSKREIDSSTPLQPNVSLGCQVVAASKRDFEKHVIGVLDDKGVKEFPYTIIEGDELEVLDRALTSRGRHSILVEGIPREPG
ncbi:MAG: hypothetical protein AMXMBFR84_40070 [Candidatus Hydrogenedentota bacterium]